MAQTFLVLFCFVIFRFFLGYQMTFVVVFVLGGFLTKADRKKILKNANYFFLVLTSLVMSAKSVSVKKKPIFFMNSFKSREIHL